jgi:hypothetical protein
VEEIYERGWVNAAGVLEMCRKLNESIEELKFMGFGPKKNILN